MAKTPVSIAQLKHRVTICTSQDVVEGGGMFVLKRTRAWDSWALLEPYRGSLFSRDGYAVKETREQQSHRIVIRVRYSFEVSSAAWIFEPRNQTQPRWYKVLSVKDIEENGKFWEFSVRLVEKSDSASAPPAAAVVRPDLVSAHALPSGVKL